MPREAIPSGILDLSHCVLCPRECGADRLHGKTGRCGEGAFLRAARAALLYYEEPCISGRQGSGAVFFDGCNMGCVFCQNHTISGGSSASRPAWGLTAEDLVQIFRDLQTQGGANINLVTPSHVVPFLIPALKKARQNGLSIPVVYNTASYEKAEALRALDGLVDIYLPDLKFYSGELSARYAGTEDYFRFAAEAIDEMVRQQPLPVFADGTHALDEEDDRNDPLMTKGVIVRHMVMPGHTEDSKKVIRYLHERYGNQIFISIMNQYTPMPAVKDDPLLSRTVSEKEYDEVVNFAVSIGVENGFLQEGGTVSESFIPKFDGTGVSRFSNPSSRDISGNS